MSSHAVGGRLTGFSRICKGAVNNVHRGRKLENEIMEVGVPLGEGCDWQTRMSECRYFS